MANRKVKTQDNSISTNTTVDHLEQYGLVENHEINAISYLHLTEFDDIDTWKKRPVLEKVGNTKRSKQPREELECKHCAYDGTFKHDGFDPVNKKGVWEKGERRICVKRHSLETQNNKGTWYICDKERIKKCHFFEPR